MKKSEEGGTSVDRNGRPWVSGEELTLYWRHASGACPMGVIERVVGDGVLLVRWYDHDEVDAIFVSLVDSWMIHTYDEKWTKAHHQAEGAE